MKKIISCVLVLAMFLTLGIGSALAGVPTEHALTQSRAYLRKLRSER